jgi:hypothetical protein
MTDAPLAQITDQRNALRPVRQIRLYADRIEWVEEGRLERRIALDAVNGVRLSVEMAGAQSQVVCRVSGPSGEILFGSRRAVSLSDWAG